MTARTTWPTPTTTSTSHTRRPQQPSQPCRPSRARSSGPAPSTPRTTSADSPRVSPLGQPAITVATRHGQGPTGRGVGVDVEDPGGRSGRPSKVSSRRRHPSPRPHQDASSSRCRSRSPGNAREQPSRPTRPECPHPAETREAAHTCTPAECRVPRPGWADPVRLLTCFPWAGPRMDHHSGRTILVPVSAAHGGHRIGPARGGTCPARPTPARRLRNRDVGPYVAPRTGGSLLASSGRWGCNEPYLTGTAINRKTPS